MYKKIGILTGGGDAPGLNAVIRAAVRTAVRQFAMEVVGIEDGYEGLIGEMQMRRLLTTNVAGLLPRGGTILGTRNSGHFCCFTQDGEMFYPEEPVKEAIAKMNREGIEALVCIGGEGTLAIAEKFHRQGFPVIGVPKTIDNDLACTELTFGFQTACDIATEALDRLHTTAESHDRVMILEVMGRDAGWIALHSGLAGSADVILIPEIPFVMEQVIKKVKAREAGGSRFTIIVAAEGAKELGGDAKYVDTGNTGKAKRLGGIGEHIRQRMEEETEKEARVVVLGHLQRGGTPNAFDRMLATNFGACAVRALAEGERGVMVALQSASIITVPLDDAVTNIKTVAADGQLVNTARDIGISFAAPDEPEFMRQ